MEYRLLGRSGLKVPVLTFGCGTFGGKGEFFQAWGGMQAAEATRIVDICLEHGVTMFDSADIYSGGASEEVLGAAIRGRRDKVLISTKFTFRSGEGPNDVGSSRHHILDAADKALKRLGTDYIDLVQLHGYDALTPQEEVLSTLDTLIKQGKIRYIGVSNFSGWHLMKALSVSDRLGLNRYVAHQAYYSLIGRDYEWELCRSAWPRAWARWCGHPWAGAASPARSGGARRCPPSAACTRPPPMARRWRMTISTRWWTRWTRWRWKPARACRRWR